MYQRKTIPGFIGGFSGAGCRGAAHPMSHIGTPGDFVPPTIFCTDSEI